MDPRPARTHRYTVALTWDGNDGNGTRAYAAYRRAHTLRVAGKPAIEGSSDPAFRGDPDRWNPEELLVAALCACHQLWYLHLCAEAGIVVTAYADRAEGVLIEQPDGAGQFSAVVLRPTVTIAPGSDPARAQALHREANARCFIARSVAFAVSHDARIIMQA